jgi:hypothetical protein
VSFRHSALMRTVKTYRAVAGVFRMRVRDWLRRFSEGQFTGGSFEWRKISP